MFCSFNQTSTGRIILSMHGWLHCWEIGSIQQQSLRPGQCAEPDALEPMPVGVLGLPEVAGKFLRHWVSAVQILIGGIQRYGIVKAQVHVGWDTSWLF